MQLLPMMKDKSKLRRVTFNEITQKAVKAAFEHSRDVDENLVDAQQTRRVLDRLVGYQVSPLLWDKVRRGLSAGRVQTVALRLIVERESEINGFKPVEYWTIDAKLQERRKESGQEFVAKFTGIDGVPARVANGTDEEGKEQFIAGALDNGERTAEVVAAAREGGVVRRSVDARSAAATRSRPTSPASCSRTPPAASASTCAAPWASRSACTKASRSARTAPSASSPTCVPTPPASIPTPSSRRASTSPASLARSTCPQAAIEYKGKKDAQDAHEAIRPTHVDYTPESIRASLSDEQYKLYKHDLAALRLLADGARHLRPDHRDIAAKGRSHLRLPRHRHRAQVRWLPQDLGAAAPKTLILPELNAGEAA